MSIRPEFECTTSDNFKRIIVSGMNGRVTPLGLEATIYSDSQDFTKTLETEPPSNRLIIKRIIECSLIIDPVQMKSTYKWWGNQIKMYEKLFGTIPSPEELHSKLDRDPNQ